MTTEELQQIAASLISLRAGDYQATASFAIRAIEGIAENWMTGTGEQCHFCDYPVDITGNHNDCIPNCIADKCIELSKLLKQMQDDARAMNAACSGIP